MKLVPRTAFGWGPTAAPAANPRNGLVIHYDGGDQGLAGKPHTACVSYWQNTRRFHMGPSRGWADIGYSYGCCPHGQVFEGRGYGRQQAAQPGGNTSWYSVTLMSGPSEHPTSAQIQAVRRLRAWLMSKGVNGAVKGHRDFYATSCPGPIAYALVRDGTFAKLPQEEDDMTKDEIFKAVWSTDAVPVPWDGKDNPNWMARSVLVDNGLRLRAIEARLDAQQTLIKELTDAVTKLGGTVDVQGLVAQIERAIEGVTVRLDIKEN